MRDELDLPAEGAQPVRDDGRDLREAFRIAAAGLDADELAHGLDERRPLGFNRGHHGLIRLGAGRADGGPQTAEDDYKGC